MKTHVLVKEGGDWSFISKLDANTYKQAGYEIMSLKKIVWDSAKIAIPFGILLTILLTINTIDNKDLRTGFLFLILMRMMSMVKW